jgi:hypothetical protein
MDSYPLPAQRKQNLHDPVAHPVLLFRDPSRPSVRPTSAGGAANNKAGAAFLGIPTSPRKLFHSSGFSASLHPVGTTRGLLPSTNSVHRRAPPMRPDHFGSAHPQGTVAGLPRSSFRRPAQEVMAYTAGSPLRRSERMLAVDSDELEPGQEGQRVSIGGRGRGASVGGGASRPFAYDTEDADESYADYAAGAADDVQRAIQAQGTITDPYVRLKNKLVALIVEHRIFRERAIVKLLDKARAINGHLNQAKVEQVLQSVRMEFEVGPDVRADDAPAGEDSVRAQTDRLDRLNQTLAEKRVELRATVTDARHAAAAAIDARKARQARVRAGNTSLTDRSGTSAVSSQQSGSLSSRSGSGSESGDSGGGGSRASSRSGSPTHRSSNNNTQSQSPRGGSQSVSQSQDSSRRAMQEEEF